MTHCSTWIQVLQHLWRKLTYANQQGSESSDTCSPILSLPDEIITDILRRLPAPDVLSCRRVHSNWLHLSSTPWFAEIHFRSTSATSILLGQDRSYYNFNTGRNGNGVLLYIVENHDSENPRLKKVHMKGLGQMKEYFSGGQYYKLYASCNGVLLLRLSCTDRYLIYNPIKREKKHFLRKDHKICGFFFDQLEREYKLVLFSTNPVQKLTNYYIHGTSMKHKETYDDDIGCSVYCPLNGHEHELGVEVSGAMFWLVRRHSGQVECCRSIMILDLKTKIFQVLPHPGPSCAYSFYRFDYYEEKRLHDQIRLLEMDRRLSLVNVLQDIVEMWVLEDVGKWMWVKKYVVNLDQRFNYNAFGGHPVVGVESGNLLINWPDRGLFWCNLWLNRFQIFENKGGGSNITVRGCHFYATRYTPNFAANIFSDVLGPSQS
ncbi:F-box/kelch-repeat protein At3g06240-like [Spinacia oleracea]|uniref:F-box/kelch-repeat protein At3g06240-like n=1 Tax=Spinacia oleracea TaxID=3562 RepID=A0A9R0K682_SPIOL|nr:F-box/kelch-repeat protein At3g06240-like [Spinacia oleracea]